MKLQSFEVRRNPETFGPEVVLKISIPFESIDAIEHQFSREESISVLGTEMLNLLEEMKSQAA